MFPRRRSSTLLAFLALAASLAAGAAGASVWWLDFSEEPSKADIIVLLGGSDYGRPAYAAELWKKGYAPEIWLSRQAVRPSVELARRLGVPMPTEEEAFIQILRHEGVPREKIRSYGERIVSTYDEARSLKAAVPPGKRLLIVTSRYHARRSRMIFRSFFGGSAVRVAATPYEPFRRLWWLDKDLASAAILELAKTSFYFVGGRFGPRPGA